ncbi:MAG: glutamyl-tRNA reductase [Cytophagales bacterium]
MQNDHSDNFHVFGIQHQNADISVREVFSLSEDQILSIYSDSKISGKGIMILSTCNRTEIWAYTNDLNQLKEVFISKCSGNMNLLNKYSFCLQGNEAIKHVFKVAAGIDSQILGDLQIQSQIKRSTKLAQEKNVLNPELNRLIQIALRFSKKIKNETSISEGAASVAYAAVQYILENSSNIKEQRVLLFGTGKIGSLTCENLRKHIYEKNLVLTNRTKENAEKLAGKIGAEVKDIKNLKEELDACDILIVASGASNYTVDRELFKSISNKKRILIDLSVPRNIDPRIIEEFHVQIADVDFLSKMQEKAIQKRRASIPRAMEIIDEGINEFESWINIRHLSPTFKAIKSKLHEIRLAELEFHKNKFNSEDQSKLDMLTGRLMDKIARQMINHLKENHHSDSDPVKTLTSVLEINKS